MKTAKFDFLWFEEEDRRKIMRASVCTDCKLHIGEELRKNLPAKMPRKGECLYSPHFVMLLTVGVEHSGCGT